MKTIFLVVIYLFCGTTILFAQNAHPEEIVEASLKAYNERNLDAFMAFFDENIEMYNFHDTQVRAKGLEEVRALYKRFFDASPQLHSKIINRIVFDNKVIDHEYITGGNGRKEPFELVFIYEIENGKIVRTTAIRKS